MLQCGQALGPAGFLSAEQFVQGKKVIFHIYEQVVMVESTRLFNCFLVFPAHHRFPSLLFVLCFPLNLSFTPLHHLIHFPLPSLFIPLFISLSSVDTPSCSHHLTSGTTLCFTSSSQFPSPDSQMSLSSPLFTFVFHISCMMMFE